MKTFTTIFNRFLFIILIIVLSIACKPKPILNFEPNWNIGDKWSVEYSTFMNAPFKNTSNGDLVFIDTAFYEVSGLIKKNSKDIFQVKVLLSETKKNYLLNVYSDDFILESVEELYGDPIDTLAFENYYGIESVLFSQSFGDIIMDFPKFPNLSGSRTIQVGEEIRVEQTDNILSNAVMIKLSSIVDNEKIESSQTWESGKLWWTSATRKKGVETKIRGKLLSE